MNYKNMYTNIDEEVVALVRNAIKVERIYRGTNEEKTMKYKKLLEALCRHYSLTPVPSLIVDTKKQDFYLQKTAGFFDDSRNMIALRKFSLVTLLHEFKHFMQIKSNRPNTEDNARGWSVSLFYRASPKLYAKAVKNGLLLFK